MAYTVLRFEKLKTFGDIGGAESHNKRERPTHNADAERTEQNRYLIGSKSDNIRQLVKSKIGNQKIRSNAVLAIECVMSASPEYFRPGNPEKAGTWDQQRLDQWQDASMKWLLAKYGDRIVSAICHLDEQTPHIQAIIVPLDEKGKLNCNGLIGGSRQVMRDLQTDYAKSVKHLGIDRGIEGSKAKHQTIRQYYERANNAFEPLPKITTPLPEKLPPEPERPGLFASKEVKQNYETDKAAWVAQMEAAQAQQAKRNAEVKAQRDRALEVARSHEAKAAQMRQLTEQVQQLKRENSQLLADRQAFKAEADRLRGTDLADCLQRVYGLQEAPDSKPHHRTRKFALPEGGNIAVTGELWTDNRDGKGGKGAINLVMHLEGFGQKGYADAVKMLAEHYGQDQVATDFARKLRHEDAAYYVKQKSAEPLKLEPVEATWPRARRYLLDVRKLPAWLVDKAHQIGRVFSDARSNVVFEREGGGYFKRSSYDPKDRPGFKQTLGRDSGPFVLRGTDGHVFVAEAPIDAMSLKAMHPHSTCVATGGNCPVERLKPILDRFGTERIFLAHDNDKAGNAQAMALERAYSPVEGADMVRWSTTLQDGKKKDWSAVLMAQPSLAQDDPMSSPAPSRTSRLGRERDSGPSLD